MFELMMCLLVVETRLARILADEKNSTHLLFFVARRRRHILCVPERIWNDLRDRRPSLRKAIIGLSRWTVVSSSWLLPWSGGLQGRIPMVGHRRSFGLVCRLPTWPTWFAASNSELGRALFLRDAHCYNGPPQKL